MGLFDGVADRRPDGARRDGRSRGVARLAGGAGARRLGPDRDGGRRRCGLRALSRRRRRRRRDPQSGREPAASRLDRAGLRAGRPESVRRARPRRCASSCRSGISAWCRRTRRPISSRGSTRWPMRSRARSSSTRSVQQRGGACEACRPAVRRGCGRPASASRWRGIGRSPSCIRICSTAGGRPARRSFLSRRWPTRRRISGADAVWLPGGYPELHAGVLAAARRFHGRPAAFWRRGRCRSMASAAATWCWGRGIEDAEGRRHSMAGLLQARDLVRQAQAASRLSPRAASAPTARWDRPARRSWATNSTMPACCRPATNRWSTAAMPPGRSCRKAGARRGSVSGTFFHAIDGLKT